MRIATRTHVNAPIIRLTSCERREQWWILNGFIISPATSHRRSDSIYVSWNDSMIHRDDWNMRDSAANDEFINNNDGFIRLFYRVTTPQRKTNLKHEFIGAKNMVTVKRLGHVSRHKYAKDIWRMSLWFYRNSIQFILNGLSGTIEWLDQGYLFEPSFTISKENFNRWKHIDNKQTRAWE